MDKIYSYTKNQPQNVEAWRFGEACRVAADEQKCGDYIDRGMILLRELEAKGYGIVKLPPNGTKLTGAPHNERNEGNGE